MCCLGPQGFATACSGRTVGEARTLRWCGSCNALVCSRTRTHCRWAPAAGKCEPVQVKRSQWPRFGTPCTGCVGFRYSVGRKRHNLRRRGSPRSQTRHLHNRPHTSCCRSSTTWEHCTPRRWKPCHRLRSHRSRPHMSVQLVTPGHRRLQGTAQEYSWGRLRRGCRRPGCIFP